MGKLTLVVYRVVKSGHRMSPSQDYMGVGILWLHYHHTGLWISFTRVYDKI